MKKKETKKTMKNKDYPLMINPSNATPRFSVDEAKPTKGAFGSYDNPTRNDKRKAEVLLKQMIRENDERIVNALWTEFENLVEDENFKFKKGIFNILTGAMGQGKTWTLINKIAKYLFKNKKLDAILVSVPQTEVADSAEWITASFKTIVDEDGDAEVVSMYDVIDLDDDIEKSLDCITRNRKFVHLMTNSKITNGTGERLIKSLVEANKTFAYFCDESHSWMVSHADAMLDNTGNPPADYEASLYEFIAEFVAPNTPYVFGLTATPNREQTGIIPTRNPNYDLSFRLVNKLPSLYDLLFRSAWFNDCGEDNFIDLEDEIGTRYRVEEYVKDFYSVSTHLRMNGVKPVMLWHTNPSHSNTPYKKEYVTEWVREMIVEGEYEANTKQVIAVLTGDKKAYRGFYDLDGTFTPAKQKEILDALRNPEHPASHLVVVQKGRMAMTINNLCGLVSFRGTEKETSGGVNSEIITISPLQLLGRLVRMCVSSNNKEIELVDDEDKNKKYFTLMDYVARASDQAMDLLAKTNSFKVLVADSETWRTAIDDFKKSFVNTLETANLEISKFRKTLYHLNSTLAPVGMRTNGGEVSNENGMDFEFETVVSQLELVRDFYEKTGEKFYVYYYKTNAIESSVSKDLRPFLKKYPTDCDFLKAFSENRNNKFLIDVDVFIAPLNVEKNPSSIVVGISCKCSLKDAGGDAVIAGIKHMTEFLDIPAVGFYRLYDLNSVEPTQAQSNVFYNVNESNFYEKVKVLREKDKIDYRFFGLNNLDTLDLPNKKFDDVAEVYDCEGYNYIWDLLSEASE